MVPAGDTTDVSAYYLDIVVCMLDIYDVALRVKRDCPHPNSMQKWFLFPITRRDVLWTSPISRVVAVRHGDSSMHTQLEADIYYCRR